MNTHEADLQTPTLPSSYEAAESDRLAEKRCAEAANETVSVCICSEEGDRSTSEPLSQEEWLRNRLRYPKAVGWRAACCLMWGGAGGGQISERRGASAEWRGAGPVDVLVGDDK